MFQTSFTKKAVVAVVAFFVAVIVTISCSKTDTSGISQFLGSWTDAVCNSHDHSNSMTISAGPNNYSLYMTYGIGAADSCFRQVNLLGTVTNSSTNNNFSIATQSFADWCGVTYDIYGSGSIVNDTLLITMVTTGPGGATTCFFKAHK